MCLIKDHGFEPKPEKAEKFYRFEVDHWTHITKAADRKRPQEGGFLGCFEKPPVSYFPAQKLTWKLKNDPLRKGSSFTHYPFLGSDLVVGGVFEEGTLASYEKHFEFLSVVDVSRLRAY